MRFILCSSAAGAWSFSSSSSSSSSSSPSSLFTRSRGGSLLGNGGVMSSRERRVLLWAELTGVTGRSLLARWPEDITRALLGPMLDSNLATRRLEEKRGKRRRKRRKRRRRDILNWDSLVCVTVCVDVGSPHSFLVSSVSSSGRSWVHPSSLSRSLHQRLSHLRLHPDNHRSQLIFNNSFTPI